MRMKVSTLVSAVMVAAVLTRADVGHAQAVPPESTAQAILPLPESAPAVSGAAPVARMSDSFADLDRDKDGALSESEALRSQPVASAFQRLDQSHDGTLDLAEFAQLRLLARNRH